mmetsp:Transcript_84585/g.149732  ORF Transcript_84585/g.149732 Transcript_84585/m.149732 type:complete len:583 (+) Transcript_84585:190-1938(+)
MKGKSSTVTTQCAAATTHCCGWMCEPKKKPGNVQGRSVTVKPGTGNLSTTPLLMKKPTGELRGALYSLGAWLRAAEDLADRLLGECRGLSEHLQSVTGLAQRLDCDPPELAQHLQAECTALVHRLQVDCASLTERLQFVTAEFRKAASPRRTAQDTGTIMEVEQVKMHRLEVEAMHGGLHERLSFLEGQIPVKHRALEEIHDTLHSRLAQLEQVSGRDMDHPAIEAFLQQEEKEASEARQQLLRQENEELRRANEVLTQRLQANCTMAPEGLWGAPAEALAPSQAEQLQVNGTVESLQGATFDASTPQPGVQEVLARAVHQYETSPWRTDTEEEVNLETRSELPWSSPPASSRDMSPSFKSLKISRWEEGIGAEVMERCPRPSEGGDAAKHGQVGTSDSRSQIRSKLKGELQSGTLSAAALMSWDSRPEQVQGKAWTHAKASQSSTVEVDARLKERDERMTNEILKDLDEKVQNMFVRQDLLKEKFDAVFEEEPREKLTAARSSSRDLAGVTSTSPGTSNGGSALGSTRSSGSPWRRSQDGKNFAEAFLHNSHHLKRKVKETAVPGDLQSRVQRFLHHQNNA